MDSKGRVTNVTTLPTPSVFGSAFQTYLDDTTATTTSTTFTSGAGFTTASLTSAGTYRIGLFFNWAISATTSDARFRLSIDGVQVGPEMRAETSETVSQSYWEQGIFYAGLSTGTHTISLDFACETAGVTLSLYQARFEMWRAS